MSDDIRKFTRYVPDMSGYRYMRGVVCPGCRKAEAVRKFSATKGSYVPRHDVRCEKRCGFEVLIKGRVVPETDGAGKMVETPVQAMQKLLDRMHADGLREANIVDDRKPAYREGDGLDGVDYPMEGGA